MKYENIILLVLVIIILVAPMIMYNGLGEDQGMFGGSDDKGVDVIGELDHSYKPWFESIWEPPSGEVESLLFAVQAAIGAIIIGYAFGYWRGQSKKD
ncbi:energy-coupling factor ABC transporter substrate-binding protein [uncultured Methanobrevibacter sp.]|uniref:energy-coupling factor ABC transporter substrate-binding protein n=1 Tax=uncultured Methanobrevibacter sp. TaxID=253161 RepID=UPI0025E771D2|nr:energy-coupling factor ABC transporter substrate-binding protein [uncultured Methanobrevibacter sp.]